MVQEMGQWDYKDYPQNGLSKDQDPEMLDGQVRWVSLILRQGDGQDADVWLRKPTMYG